MKRKCDKRGINVYCNNQDVLLVQLRDRATGPNGPNTFNGPVVLMCAGCRKANRGQFKIAVIQ